LRATFLIGLDKLCTGYGVDIRRNDEEKRYLDDYFCSLHGYTIFVEVYTPASRTGVRYFVDSFYYYVLQIQKQGKINHPPQSEVNEMNGVRRSITAVRFYFGVGG